MEPDPLRHQLAALRQRVAFLRALAPDGPAYKLWLGDVIELVNTKWGVGSTAMQGISEILRRREQERSSQSDASAQAAYLERLRSMELILERYEKTLGCSAQ